MKKQTKIYSAIAITLGLAGTVISVEAHSHTQNNSVFPIHLCNGRTIQNATTISIGQTAINITPPSGLNGIAPAAVVQHHPEGQCATAVELLYPKTSGGWHHAFNFIASDQNNNFINEVINAPRSSKFKLQDLAQKTAQTSLASIHNTSFLFNKANKENSKYQGLVIKGNKANDFTQFTQWPTKRGNEFAIIAVNKNRNDGSQLVLFNNNQGVWLQKSSTQTAVPSQHVFYQLPEAGQQGVKIASTHLSNEPEYAVIQTNSGVYAIFPNIQKYHQISGTHPSYALLPSATTTINTISATSGGIIVAFSNDTYSIEGTETNFKLNNTPGLNEITGVSRNGQFISFNGDGLMDTTTGQYVAKAIMPNGKTINDISRISSNGEYISFNDGGLLNITNGQYISKKDISGISNNGVFELFHTSSGTEYQVYNTLTGKTFTFLTPLPFSISNLLGISNLTTSGAYYIYTGTPSINPANKTNLKLYKYQDKTFTQPPGRSLLTDLKNPFQNVAFFFTIQGQKKTIIGVNSYKYQNKFLKSFQQTAGGQMGKNTLYAGFITIKQAKKSMTSSSIMTTTLPKILSVSYTKDTVVPSLYRCTISIKGLIDGTMIINPFQDSNCHLIS